jgi:hypothetical protein
MTRPPERRIVVPNYSGSGKPHKDQLRDLANTILENMRNSANDPKAFKTFCESYAHLDKLLKEDLSTENKPTQAKVDVSDFEE